MSRESEWAGGSNRRLKSRKRKAMSLCLCVFYSGRIEKGRWMWYETDGINRASTRPCACVCVFFREDSNWTMEVVCDGRLKHNKGSLMSLSVFSWKNQII